MVIDSGSFLDGVVQWILGVTIGVLMAGVILAAVVSMLGLRHFGFVAIVLSLTLIVSIGVIAIVLDRARTEDATIYDWMWAIGLCVLGYFSGQRLFRRPTVDDADPPR